jgi:hypothetical protein
MSTITPSILYSLLFPSCDVTLDDFKSHFIRRTYGNNLAIARVISLETAELLRPIITTDLFFLQTINEDGLHYCVLWEKTEWEHSVERRRTLREEFLQRDVSHLIARAHELRIHRIAHELVRSAIFPRDKAEALAKSITSRGEETYREKSQHLIDTLRGAFAADHATNIIIYFPIEQIIKEIDHRNIYESNAQAVYTSPPQNG